MKLKDLLRAKDALKKLTEKRFASYAIISKLVKLRKAVQSEIEIYIEQERKAITDYAELDAAGNPIFTGGGIKLKDSQAKIDFERELEELREANVDNIEPVTLTEKDFRFVEDIPTPDEIIELEPLVVFE